MLPLEQNGESDKRGKGRGCWVGGPVSGPRMFINIYRGLWPPTASPAVSYVMLGKLLHISEPQFDHRYNGLPSPIGLELNRIYIKCIVCAWHMGHSHPTHGEFCDPRGFYGLVLFERIACWICGKNQNKTYEDMEILDMTDICASPSPRGKMLVVFWR